MRPFHFALPVWGEKYTGYFLDRLAPSLLSPGNFPLLWRDEGHTLFIVCPIDDWARIVQHDITAELARHVTIKWVQAPTPYKLPEAVAPYHNNSIWQERYYYLGIEAAYDPRAYGSLINPDLIISDRMIESMIVHAGLGYHVLHRIAIREDEERVLAHMPAGVLTPSAAVDLHLRYLHPEMAAFRDEHVPHNPTPHLRFWDMPGGGRLAHCDSIPFMAYWDFAIVPDNHLDALNHGAWENEYARRNFPPWTKVKIVQEPEFHVLGITPTTINHSDAWIAAERKSPKIFWKLRGMIEIRRARQQRAWMGPYHEQLWRTPLRFYVGAKPEGWDEAEAKIERMLERAVAPSLWLDFCLFVADRYRYYRTQPLQRLAVKLLQKPWRLLKMKVPGAGRSEPGTSRG